MKKVRKAKELLEKETSRLKEYLERSLKEKNYKNEIFTLSEYLKKNPNTGIPEKVQKNKLLKWKAANKIQNLIRIELSKNERGEQSKINISLNLEEVGEDTQNEFSYSLPSSIQSSEKTQQATNALYTQVASALRENNESRHFLNKRNFIPGWDSAYLETGLSAGAGFTSFSTAAPVSIQTRAFLRVSPGAFSENYKIDLLSGFTQPILKPIVFDLSFGFTYTLPTTVETVRDEIDNIWPNNIHFKFYAFSLGAGYTYTFQRRMRVLAGFAFSYYISFSKNDFFENNTQIARVTKQVIHSPAFLLYTTFQYLLLQYIAVGSRLEYMHYFSNSLSEDIQHVYQIGLSIEVSYVF